MSLLDRLKPQPKWKHPDPHIRAAAVLDLDDADELRSIVREDADAAVRRAAVKRLGDAAVLADVARKSKVRRSVQALLEERMACGTGICYGCAVFTRRGVRLVCKDGPRFELREVF